jgi:uncharacterized protein
MIVVTGASDGLGKEIAKLYQQAGVKVVNISRTESEYADINVQADLTKGSEIERAADEVKNLGETIDAIIFTAGIFTKQPLGHITEDEIKRAMASNVKQVILFVSELSSVIAQDATDIVVVSSSAGIKPTSEFVYGASKWAVRGFTLGLQHELKATKSRVISVVPGGMNTEFFKKADQNVDTASFMDPKEVAKVIKSTLDLPKNIEVSEIVLNRK